MDEQKECMKYMYLHKWHTNNPERKSVGEKSNVSYPMFLPQGRILAVLT